jgi:hypothetical protein
MGVVALNNNTNSRQIKGVQMGTLMHLQEIQPLQRSHCCAQIMEWGEGAINTDGNLRRIEGVQLRHWCRYEKHLSLGIQT